MSAGKYVLLTEVSRGYIGALWLGRDPREGGAVFVRRIAPLVSSSTRAAVLDAARWSQTTDETGTTELVEGRASVDVISRFGDGELLRSLLRTAALKHIAVEPTVLLGIARDLLARLSELHAQAARDKSLHEFGGVHPDSIFVGADGSVRLLDAGVGAAASAREPWRSDPQRIGYFAPEQIDLRGVLGPGTDVFAVGVVLWEALSNRRLFPGNDAKTTRERVQRSPITRLDAVGRTGVPGVATDIADIVSKALERDPAARFGSVAEMAEAVGRLACANGADIGAWVALLADAAIGKRRQLLERVAGGGSIPPPSGPVSVESGERRESVDPAERTASRGRGRRTAPGRAGRDGGSGGGAHRRGVDARDDRNAERRARSGFHDRPCGDGQRDARRLS